jgi:hypothetical protein
MSDALMTYEDLAARWEVSPRQVRRLCKRWRLQPMDLGHRTKRFRPADVHRAESKMAGETDMRGRVIA